MGTHCLYCGVNSLHQRVDCMPGHPWHRFPSGPPTAERSTDEHPSLVEAGLEMLRQDVKWGQQDHPDTPSGAAPYLSLGIPSEHHARASCEDAFEGGTGTWGHILVEEVAEAVGAESEAHLREELIQVAAVCLQWVEAIDRRGEKS